MANRADAFLKIKCKINGKIEDAFFLEDEDIFGELEAMSYDAEPYFINKEKFIIKTYGRWSYTFFINFDEDSGLTYLLDEIKEKNLNVEKLYFIFYEIDFGLPGAGIFVKEVDIKNKEVIEYYENTSYDIFFYCPKLNEKNKKETCISFYKKNYLLFSKICNVDKFFEYCEDDDFDYYYEQIFVSKFIYEKFLLFSEEIEKIIEIEDETLKKNEINKAIKLTVRSIKNYFDLFKGMEKRKDSTHKI